MKIPLGFIPSCVLIGDIPFLFENAASYAIETVCYCSMGVIHGHDFHDMIKKTPTIKKDMVQEILDNPYDHMREEFIETCRKHISYLKDVDTTVLKKLYYKSE